MREFQRMQLMPWSRPGLDWQRRKDASERGSSRMMMPCKGGNPREPWLPWGTLINVEPCYIDKSWTVRTVERSMFFDDFETSLFQNPSMLLQPPEFFPGLSCHHRCREPAPPVLAKPPVFCLVIPVNGGRFVS